VKHEMQWTILWFQHQVNLWSEHSKRKDVNLPVGHKGYAVKQKKTLECIPEEGIREIFIVPFIMIIILHKYHY
jgi:hypothetical protein